MAKKGGNSKSAEGPKSVQNRRARYDYEIVDSFEAGIQLVGSEVKSVYLGRVNLTDSFCRILNGELWAMQIDVEPYAHSSHFQPERRRDRKLLMHKKEIDSLQRQSQEKGFSIIPLAMYFKNGKVKVQVGLGRGKKQYDKRDQIQRDETRREEQRIARERR